MEKTILIIDGGYLRKISKKLDKKYTPEYIEKCAQKITEEENLLRILYYDCLPYEGEVILPISKNKKKFESVDWMEKLGKKEFFAIRKGKLKFRGYTLKKESQGKANLTDDDFEPNFEQKGVDMRIGLDIANYSHNRIVDKIIIATNDTDCVPALKDARRSGISISLVELNRVNLSYELLLHVDKIIKIELP